ncbi:hypothetical protein A9255_00245 [Xenorhabdus hominickii]|uniref:DUF7823 domain-containing protein n=2 Tax=Xenorhabdus hominickii TaxID=351679 RepID=A0A2G0PZZ7_XENHO|nr:hypothetical protein A9255_00245 [Xenorhabdus hominickii]PHM52540.1 hypothetical protein Xhom_04206 [Xenorhabdus hominickii]
MVALFAKNLTVTVGGTTYHLGSATDYPLTGKQEYEFVGKYINNLGNLLKQNEGNTLHFCLNWK